MVTLIGVFAQFLGIVLILFYDTSMTQTLPIATHLTFAFLMFCAQTFDAVDGIHARNTNRCSPLGQLMDHGCDAFSNSFFIIMCCQCHLFGASSYTVILQACVQVIILFKKATFFVMTWEENLTGIIKTHVNNMGVTEFQFIGMGLLVLPVIFGESLHHVKIYGFSLVGIFIYLNGLL
jgi:ethanolaminephosphotransferase